MKVTTVGIDLAKAFLPFTGWMAEARRCSEKAYCERVMTKGNTPPTP